MEILDITNSTENLWYSKVQKHVDGMVTFVFKSGINSVKKHYEDGEYSNAKAIVSFLKNAFDEDYLKTQPWGKDALQIKKSLGDLEESLIFLSA